MRSPPVYLTTVVETPQEPGFGADRTMRRILSPRGPAVATGAACLAFEGLLVGMASVRAWHPHYLPVAPMLVLVIAAGLALVVVASWRVVRGPGRGRALAWLLIGAAPLWFLAGHFLHGAAAG